MKIYSWVIALILTIACISLMHSSGYTAKRIDVLTNQVTQLNGKCEALSIDTQRYITQEEFAAYQTDTDKRLQAQQWRYEEYKGLDEVLTAWFGKQQSAIVGRGAK